MFKRKKSSKLKCNLCENTITDSGNNAIVVLSDSVRIEICDECEKLISVISTKYNALHDEMLNDKTKDGGI